MTVVAVPVVVVAGAGGASADVPLGQATNSCFGDGTAQLPVATGDGVFVGDSGIVFNQIMLQSYGTASFEGSSRGWIGPTGIRIESKGLGVGDLYGNYARSDGRTCFVRGLFLLT